MQIPKEVYDYLMSHPNVTGRELCEKGLVNSDRTGRRFKSYFMQGATPGQTPSFISRAMDEYEEQAEITLDEMLEIAPVLMKQAQVADPVVITDEITILTDEPIAITFPSCAHLGSRYTAYEAFREFFDSALLMPNLLWASLGDDIEGFIPSFRDADAVAGQVYSTKVQLALLDRLLNILNDSGKLLLGTGSQHGGKWYQSKTGDNPIKRMYLDKGKSFYDGQAYVRINVGNESYNVAFAHEFPGNSQWNALHPQTRALRFNFPMADAIIMGDKHHTDYQMTSVYQWEVELGNRKSPFVWLIQVGTAKTGPDKFTISHWSCGIFEWPTLVFYPDHHEIKVSKNLSDIKLWLEE